MSNKISVHLRRNTILTRLKQGELLNSNNLADEFNVSRRTIHRDFIEYFSSIEERLVQNPDTHQWYISKEEQNSFLTQKEQVALELLLDLSKKHSSEFYLETKSLIDKFRSKNDESIFYSKLDAENFEDIKEKMVKVEKAILNHKVISCTYKDKQRTVAPLKIASFDGYWYLIVKDLNKNKQDINTYYFKDIQNLNITDKTHNETCPQLQKKLECALNAYFRADVDCYPIVLHATNKIAKFFIRKPISKTQRIIEKYSDGSIDFEVMITNDMEIRPLIKKYSPDLKEV